VEPPPPRAAHRETEGEGGASPHLRRRPDAGTKPKRPKVRPRTKGMDDELPPKKDDEG
jgi:hypothetical protein